MAMSHLSLTIIVVYLFHRHCRRKKLNNFQEENDIMSGDFSWIDALDKLYLDPYPTKKFRAILKLLQNVSTILEEIHEIRMCCIGDIITKLEITLEGIPKSTNNHFVPTAEVYKALTQKKVPEKFVSILSKLLLYIIVKLNRCTSEDAASIMYDFNNLLDCIFVYRKYSTWDNSKFDDLIVLFLKKLIQMVKGLTVHNRGDKFHLFSVIRIMIIEFGKHPAYSSPILVQLNQEISYYYQHLKEINTKVESYIHENYLSHLYILNETIGKILIHHNKEDVKSILSDLQNVLKDIVALNKMNAREAYLVQNIGGIIGVYLSA